jgi:hypothetical protein
MDVHQNARLTIRCRESLREQFIQTARRAWVCARTSQPSIQRITE